MSLDINNLAQATHNFACENVAAPPAAHPPTTTHTSSPSDFMCAPQTTTTTFSGTSTLLVDSPSSSFSFAMTSAGATHAPTTSSIPTTTTTTAAFFPFVQQQQQQPSRTLASRAGCYSPFTASSSNEVCYYKESGLPVDPCVSRLAGPAAGHSFARYPPPGYHPYLYSGNVGKKLPQ